VPFLKHRKALDSISSHIPAKSFDEVKKEFGLDNIIKLFANENNMGCSPLVQTAIEESIKDLAPYPDGYCTKLRAKLAEKYNLKQEQLIFGNGSFELLSLMAQAFINPGEESIIPEPSFGWYKVVTLAMDGVIVSLPLKDHVINLEEIKDNITSKTKIIWICNPNNPTGTIIVKDNLNKFLKEVPSDVIVILDEAYFDFVYSRDYPDSVKLLHSYSNLIILRTFSKVYGLASMRIGYGIANSEIINYLNKIRMPVNVNTLAQVAALASLNDETFKKACIENNSKGKEYFYESFKELNLEYIPTQGNFIMVNVEKDSVAVFNEILKRGICVRAGTEFGMPTWLRVTIGRPEENELFVRKLKEVLNFS